MSMWEFLWQVFLAAPFAFGLIIGFIFWIGYIVWGIGNHEWDKQKRESINQRGHPYD